jgi:hexosaminidase
MKTILLYFIFIICAEAAYTQSDLVCSLIPQAQKITIGRGYFELNSKTKISAQSDLNFRANQLKNYLEPATGFYIKIDQPGQLNNIIKLKLNKNLSSLGDEGYKLGVDSNKITIEAFSSKGIFWGIQTLRQLLSVNILRNARTDNVSWYVPRLQIEDQPRFKWRGLMIDYSRTFWNKQLTERYIDAMAYYKMNILHMHLTDDQGWRVEIGKYPELTKKASLFDTIYHEPEEMEGYYSKGDIKEIVEYARQRNIEIVPEIEMPGHSSEVFSVYPGYSCKGDTLKIQPFFKGPGIHKEIYCAGNDNTFKFLEGILSEIFDLFPSEYVHIGGDEAPKDHWKNCPLCQKRIKDYSLKDENELQSWFIKRIESFLNAHGRKLIGWDEITEGGLSKTATVMYWRSGNKDIPALALKQGNSIVMSPTDYCYFDYTYEKIPTKKVYSFNPSMAGSAIEYKDNILGVQGNFWSHINRTIPEMDRQIFPRILALSEIGWTQDINKNWDSFYSRLKRQLTALDIMGIYYHKESK